MSDYHSDNRWASRLARHDRQVISILSGKGGVGKSVISFNLAERLAASGKRVLLADADFSGGNQHILANLDCPCGLIEFASDQLNLAEAVTRVADNLDLLAMTGLALDADLHNAGPAAQLAARIREQSADYDFVIIDHGSGASEAAVVFAHASDICLMIMVPELTSICNAYGLYKHLVSTNRRIDCRLVINWVQGEFEAPYIAGKVIALGQRFLSCAPVYLGSLPEDSAIKRSVAAQAPLAQVDPEAPVLTAIEQLGQLLVNPADNSSLKSSASNKKQINVLTATADKRE